MKTQITSIQLRASRHPYKGKGHWLMTQARSMTRSGYGDYEKIGEVSKLGAVYSYKGVDGTVLEARTMRNLEKLIYRSIKGEENEAA